jgi:hypothetical protein
MARLGFNYQGIGRGAQRRNGNGSANSSSVQNGHKPQQELEVAPLVTDAEPRK